MDLSELSKYKTVTERYKMSRNLISKQLKKKRFKNCFEIGGNLFKEENAVSIHSMSAWCRMCRISKKELREKIEFSCGSYEDYVYQDGDVVYCDPPYEGTGVDYNYGFDFVKFYDWAYSRPYPVYFSSYEISDKRFFKVWEKKRVSSLGETRVKFNEILWSNRPEIEGRKNLLKMFR